MTDPVPGTVRYFCPLECGWHYDQPPPSLADMAGIVPASSAYLPEFISWMARQAMRRCAELVDQAAREHLATHTTEEFAQAIHDLRVRCENLARQQAQQTSPRDDLWESLGIDPDRVSREEFEEYMDVHDRKTRNRT